VAMVLDGLDVKINSFYETTKHLSRYFHFILTPVDLPGKQEKYQAAYDVPHDL
jgi:hypothetical protein